MKKYILVLPVLLMALFLAFSPAKASAGNFPIVVSGGDITITEGETITRTVVVGNPDGYTGNIQIHASRSDMPPGVNVTFSPDTGIISTGMSFQTTATFKADGLVLAGSYKYLIEVTPPGQNLEYGTATKLNMTTLNKVNPTKAMPSTVNTIRASATKMTGLRLELPDPNPGDSFTALVGNGVFSVKSWTNPVLIMDKNYGLGTIGTRWFSLADPLNPQEDVSKRVGIPYFYCGDPGGQHYANSLSYSRDGQYLAGNFYNCGSAVSIPGHNLNDGVYLTGADPSFYRFIRPDNIESNPIDIFESKTPSNSHVYYTSFNRGGVVRLDGITSSGASLEEMQTGSKTSFIYPELPATAPNIPKTSASGGVRTIVMAGATDHVAVLTGPGNTMSITPNKLSVYIPTENNPVAELNLSSGINSITNLTSFVTSDMQYVMFTASLPWINASQVSTSQLSIYDPKRSSNLLYVYKFDPATNTLTKVVEGIKIVGVIGTGLTQQSIAGIRVGNKDGVMVLLNDDITTNNWMKPVIYMFSDLSAGNLKNVFVDATYSVAGNIYQNGGGAKSLIASLNKGDTTYVYLNTQGTCEGVNTGTITSCTGIAVIKFDPSGVNVGETPPPPPSVAICQDSTSLNYGGTLPCRYPPTPRPACSPGDLFSTVTSLPCSGATGTERKISCVNLSSSFYCSYTPDTLVTAVTPTPLSPTPPPPSNPPPPTPPLLGTGVKITTSKDVYTSMFPNINCPSSNLTCVAGIRYDDIKIDQSSNPPTIWGGEMRWTDSAASKAIETGPRRFSLADPLNPVRDTSIPQNNIDTYHNTFGDFGFGVYVQQMAMSKDGAYQFIWEGSQSNTWGWHNGKELLVSGGAGGGHIHGLAGVVNHGDKTLLVYSAGVTDVTNVDTLGTYNASRGVWLAFPPLPAYGPKMTGGPKFILSNTDFIASLEGSLGAPYVNERFAYDTNPENVTVPRIRIYDLGQTAPVDTLSLPNLAGLYPEASFVQSAPDGDYIVLFFAAPFKIPTCTLATISNPGGCTGGDPNSQHYAAGKVFVYKFDFSTEKLSTVVNGTTLETGLITSATGFRVGGNLGIIAFRKVYKGIDSGGYEIFEENAEAYLISDLAAGKATNVLTNAPPPGTWKDSVQSSASLVKGNTTYVYLNYSNLGTPLGGGKILVWQLDSSSIAGVTSSSGSTTLKLGSTGSEVVALQNFLNTAGYDCGTADGSFGPKTQAAVIKFQIANGLVGDGVVGAQTRAALNK